MAHITCNFLSRTLRVQTTMNVILPEQRSSRLHGERIPEEGRYPVLWLFHGLSDDENSWIRYTSIERYAEQYGLAVVMPDVQRSYYNDMAAGGRYWSFISDELFIKARSFFPLSRMREYNYAAGLSMGGFGAFKMALNMPDAISAAGSLSGVLDIPIRMQMNRGRDEFRIRFGDVEDVRETGNDLLWLAGRPEGSPTAQPGPTGLPGLFQCCGTEDTYLQMNRNFKAAAEAGGISVQYEEDAGYGHTWDYWDLKIQTFLRWIADR